jgi:hypothetical protein
VKAAARVVAALPAARACYGAALLSLPGFMTRIVAGQRAGSRARSVARLLGARHLAQAALTARPAPGAARLAIGAAADLTHAASVAGLAAADRGMRRAALADAAIEVTFAAAGLTAARQAP